MATSGKTGGVGNDNCPKCGSSDLKRTYTPDTTKLNIVCNTCTFTFILDPLDAAPV